MLNWNDYNGWGNPEYTLMIWDIDSGIWSAVNQVNNPTQNSNIGFDYNQISDRPGGRFALRIDAVNSDSSYVAKSNYIYLDVPEVPIPNNVFIEDLSIPNIFTPNGDGENDYFTIKGIQAWRNVSVTILNRWGNVVFKDENFQVNNFWDGTSNNKPVSDGVYFYKIDFTGSLSGHGDLKETGYLKIIR
jgi:gliding motility-associated-like protein